LNDQKLVSLSALYGLMFQWCSRARGSHCRPT